MMYVHLTERQRDELSTLSRQAVGRVALRAHMVLRSDRGFSVQEIAAIHACGQDVGRTWRPRDERAGVAGLEDDPRSGRPPRDPLAGLIVEAQASQSPPWSGHVQTCWSVARLSAFLAERLRLLLSCASVRRLLHQMGWRWARPRLAPARMPDPEAQAKRTALQEATEQARQGLAHLL
jgi:transposase